MRDLTVEQIKKAMDTGRVRLTFADLFAHAECPCSWIVVHEYRSKMRDDRGGHHYAIFWPVRHEEGTFPLDNVNDPAWSGGYLD